VAVGVDTLAALADALAVDPGKLLSAEAGRPQAIAAVKAQLAAKIERLLTRDDLPALQSMTIIAGLVDNALARRSR